MTKLYVGKIEKDFEVPESVVNRYNLKVGGWTPFTRIQLISVEDKKSTIDIKAVSQSKGNNIDIKEIKAEKNDIDIKEISHDKDNIDMKKGSNKAYDIDIKEISK